jgi:hypothetical protein
VRIFRSRPCLFRHTSTDSTEAVVSAIATQPVEVSSIGIIL